MSYQHLKRAGARIGAVAAAWMLLAGTAGAQDGLPSYYPADYGALVEQAQAESGQLTIYSSYTQQAWDPVFRAFQAKYPFVSRVRNLDLEGEEVYQRLKTEHAVGNPVVDIVEIQPNIGARLQNEQELLLAYQSPEQSQYPAELISPYQNGFQYAVASMVIGYNAKVLPRPVNSLAEIAELLEESGSGTYTVGVRNIASGFAFGMYNNLLSAKPELWSHFETILANAKAESSSGSLLTKLQTGEYAAAIFVIDSTMLPAVKQSAGLLGVALATDGTPFQGAAVSIAADAPNPATAKLFVDFMLSQEGQQAILAGGRAAIRNDLDPVEGLYSFEQATSQIPPEAVVVSPYVEVSPQRIEEFSQRWNGLLGQ